jgi:AmmeMemoRadiSam system protein A
LFECVQRRAVDAAVNDVRFFGNRVTPAELGAIEIEISVLTPPTPATPEDIVVGRDGVFLTVDYNRGVFLPQVPVEQGWDRDAYLDNLCHKAGSSDPNCWRRPDAKLERFEAIVFSEREMGL